MTLDLAPNELAKHLSRGKAEAVAARHKDAVVLGADSFVVFHGQLLGKPHTKERAYEMLTILRGDCHEFITGFTIIDSSSCQSHSEVVVSKVYFRSLSSIGFSVKRQLHLRTDGPLFFPRRPKEIHL